MSSAGESAAQPPRAASEGGILDWFRGPVAIAVYTYREGIRKKTLIGFLILSLLVIFGASVMSSFLNPDVMADASTDLDMKLIKDICVTTISIFGMLIAIFISASVVPAEMENKVIYTVLSKPVRRFQYLLGKFAGVQLIVIVNLALMSMLFFLAVYMRQGVFPTLLLWSSLLNYFEFLIVSSFTFAISCTSTSSVLPTIAGLFIYIVGNLTDYLKDVQARIDDSAAAVDKAVGFIATALYNVLPNLQSFSLKTQILNSQPNDPPTDVMIPNLMLYGVTFAAAGFLMAYIIFRRKEL